MDYYQGVVTEYLRADRSVFLNTECCIQLNADNAFAGGSHWYCDAVAVNLKESTVYLCEVSYAKSLDALLKRLGQWNTHWQQLQSSLVRNCHVDPSWRVRPWLFIPEACVPKAVACIEGILAHPKTLSSMPAPRITTLEAVAPWHYQSWDRVGENMTLKPATIPDAMRA